MTFSLLLTSNVVSSEIEIERCILIRATCDMRTYINAGKHIYVLLTSGIIAIQETIGKKAK